MKYICMYIHIYTSFSLFLIVYPRYRVIPFAAFGLLPSAALCTREKEMFLQFASHKVKRLRSVYHSMGGLRWRRDATALAGHFAATAMVMDMSIERLLRTPFVEMLISEGVHQGR